MKKFFITIGALYAICAACILGNRYFHFFPEDIFANVLWIGLLTGAAGLLFVTNRTRLLGLVKKWINRCRQAAKESPLTPEREKAARQDFIDARKQSAEAFYSNRQSALAETALSSTPPSPKKKDALSIGLWVIGITAAAFFLLILGLEQIYLYRKRTFPDGDHAFLGDMVNTSGKAFLWMITGLYWIPALLAWCKIEAGRVKTAAQAAGNLSMPSKYETYRVLIAGGLIGFSLFVQALFHGYTFYPFLYGGDAYGLLCGPIYIFLHTLFSSGLVFWLYRAIDQKQKERLRLLSLITHGLMLPAVYFIPLFTARERIARATNLISGLFTAPLIVFLNALSFYALLSLWYIIRKRRHKMP